MRVHNEKKSFIISLERGFLRIWFFFNVYVYMLFLMLERSLPAAFGDSSIIFLLYFTKRDHIYDYKNHFKNNSFQYMHVGL